jgi:hypothetical protein
MCLGDAGTGGIGYHSRESTDRATGGVSTGNGWSCGCSRLTRQSFRAAIFRLQASGCICEEENRKQPKEKSTCGEFCRQSA